MRFCCCCVCVRRARGCTHKMCSEGAAIKVGSVGSPVFFGSRRLRGCWIRVGCWRCVHKAEIVNKMWEVCAGGVRSCEKCERGRTTYATAEMILNMPNQNSVIDCRSNQKKAYQSCAKRISTRNFLNFRKRNVE